MKICALCGRTYPPEQALCPACGLALMLGLLARHAKEPAPPRSLAFW